MPDLISWISEIHSKSLVITYMSIKNKNLAFQKIPIFSISCDESTLCFHSTHCCNYKYVSGKVLEVSF